MKKQFRFPEKCLYQSTYVWLEEMGRGVIRLGITDYAQFSLDDIISITLPEKGIYIEKDEELISIDSIEETIVITAPISGTIEEINEELRQSPELLNESPYKEGWILELEIGDNDDLDLLMDVDEVLDAYQEEIEDEELEDEDFKENIGDYDLESEF
ncbi:MAG: glycine cleavage system protein H [Asgard group archaeon]|nr:glycine cleavage system protein H [Asgard group archaeon]